MSLSLVFRIAIIFGLTAFCIAGGMVFLMLELQEENLFREALRGAEHFAETLRKTTHLAMMRNQRQDLQNIISQASTVKNIEAVRIINKSGVVTFSSHNEEIGTKVDMEAEACVICHAKTNMLVAPDRTERMRIFKKANSNERFMGFITPIYNEKSCGVSNCHSLPENQKVLGVIDVKLSLADIDKVAEIERRHLFFIIAIVSIVLALAAGAVTYVTIAKPIKDMVGVCRHISGLKDEEMNLFVTPTGAKELVDLAEAFNAMTVRLAAANNTLEEKVRERTEQLRKAEGQLIRTEKLAALGTLSAGIAHELNNPLTGIIMYSHILLRSEKLPEDFEKKLRIIISEAERCSKILSDLLAFARTKKSETVKSTMKSFLNTIISLISVQPRFQNVLFEIEDLTEGKMLIFEKDAVQQVLINLFNNAAEAGASIIKITSSEKDNMIEIIVDDNGSGIRIEEIHKIFDPFYTTKSVGSGTGLGLWNCYRILTELRGSIEALPKPNSGTIFIIKFPK